MRADEAAAAAAAAARTCSRTRREKQPWWEVDLGGAFPVRCIRVHHPNRRTEATKAGASPFVDVSPFWIMTSAVAIGEASPEEAKELALSSKRVGSHGKVTVWNLGVNHFAAAVRVQAEGVKSLQLARVEVIKGGGTQQAKDAIHQQLLVARAGFSFPPSPQHHQSTTDDATVIPAASLMAPQGSTSTSAARSNNANKNSTIDSYPAQTFSKSNLLRFYQQDRAADAASAGSSGGGYHPTATASAAAAAGGLGSTEESHCAQTCPAMTDAVAGSLSYSFVGHGERCPTTAQQHERRRRRQRRRGKGAGLPGENVRRLLLRAMVGYDWVDDFNGNDVRVRGAFTEQDVAVLEEIFFRCGLGDDAGARAAATVSDQSIRLDPGELCGDLRRLQLQVQTNPGGKGKTPMLLAIRESPNLFQQLLSSSVVEALPDALARAEALLPPAQRPLCLDWTRFLGVMGLCLEGVYTGAGLPAPSSVAQLFEEKTDDMLEFLTRRCNRLPPRQAVTRDGQRDNKYRGIISAVAAAARVGMGGIKNGFSEVAPGEAIGAGTAAAAAAGGGVKGVAAGWSSTAEDTSLRETGSFSVDTGDDTFLESSATSGGGGGGGGGGSGSGSGGRRGREATRATTRAQDREVGGDGLTGTGGGGGCWRDGQRRGRGGGAAALKALLRPQARHAVFKGYGEAVSKRRERQREALRRTPEPDVEPTRAYKSCGLCQAPFPVESLGSTVSLKVLGTFLAKAGAPSERFDRKASRLCALHRLPLCVFCSQFFDPDFPGGIVPPGRKRNKGKKTDGGLSVSSSSVSPSLASSSSLLSPSLPSSPGAAGPVKANGLVPFFDDRFPNRSSDTPPPSSAPAVRALSPPPPSSSPLFSTLRPREAAGASCYYANVQEEYGPTLSFAAKRDETWGGGGGSGVGGRHHVCEATGLREVGGLVRRGCSIRDRLAAVPS
ncbi:unnamed protein product [Pylaiella littoralis]